MLRRVRTRAAEAAAELLSRHADAGRMTRVFERVQTARARVEEVEGALLHFWLLPARDDLRALRRRLHRLRREIRAVEQELGRLEGLVDEDRT